LLCNRIGRGHNTTYKKEKTPKPGEIPVPQLVLIEEDMNLAWLIHITTPVLVHIKYEPHKCIYKGEGAINPPTNSYIYIHVGKTGLICRTVWHLHDGIMKDRKDIDRFIVMLRSLSRVLGWMF
jgi:hypothetical protein